MRINHKCSGEGKLSPEYKTKLYDMVIPKPYLSKEQIKYLKEGDFHLYIGTPSRDEQCYIGYASSLAYTVSALISVGTEVTVDQVRNSCYVGMARNILLKKFLNTNATHILMIDDDMSWTPLAPLRMLARNKEFIAGAGPMKGQKKFACEVIEKENDLRVCKEVGGAFIMLSRVMVEKMEKKYKEKLGHPALDGFPSLFEDAYTPTTWISEDYVFCDRWRALGGKVYVDPDIHFEHLGKAVQIGSLKQEENGNADLHSYIGRQYAA